MRGGSLPSSPHGGPPLRRTLGGRPTLALPHGVVPLPEAVGETRALTSLRRAMGSKGPAEEEEDEEEEAATEEEEEAEAVEAEAGAEETTMARASIKGKKTKVVIPLYSVKIGEGSRRKPEETAEAGDPPRSRSLRRVLGEEEIPHP